MKLPALALTLASLAAPALAGERTVTFDVPGMYCPSCPYIVQSAMQSVEGVISVQADSRTKTAIVVFDDEITTINAIELASEQAGYDAFLVEEGNS